MEGVVRTGEPQTLVPNQTVDRNWQPVATGDFNLDGKTGDLRAALEGVVRVGELPAPRRPFAPPNRTSTTRARSHSAL